MLRRDDAFGVEADGTTILRLCRRTRFVYH
jgi:hypothetical protein